MANYNSEPQPLPGYSLLAINTSNPSNDPTNNTNNTQSTASNVQAATTTTISGNNVGMQTTGAPVVPLALALFSVLGGLAAARKKNNKRILNPFSHIFRLEIFNLNFILVQTQPVL